MIYVFLAEGFEEIEALTAVDVLRRAGQSVQTVGVTGTEVTGAHGIAVKADIPIASADAASMEMVVLPGGMPGTRYLDESAPLRAILKAAEQNEKAWITAICAAPSVLGHAGILKGRKATCYPGFEAELLGAEATGEAVVQDGRIITSRGPGTALAFALRLAEVLTDKNTAEQLGASMQCAEI